MTDQSINKIEAARRQINAAIRLLFDNEDPLPIHTLIMAAFRILRDLASKKDTSRVHATFCSMIKPGMEKKFWRETQSFYNFIKHADKDPEAIYDMPSEEINDASLLIASQYYQELSGTLSQEMQVFFAWFGGKHPEIMYPMAPDIVKTHLKRANTSLFANKTRREQLSEGKILLHMIKTLEEEKHNQALKSGRGGWAA